MSSPHGDDVNKRRATRAWIAAAILSGVGAIAAGCLSSAGLSDTTTTDAGDALDAPRSVDGNKSDAALDALVPNSDATIDAPLSSDAQIDAPITDAPPPPPVDANTCPASSHACGLSCCPNILQLSVGDDFSCAITQSQTVKCWGHNDYGTVGIGTTIDTPTPTEIPNLTGVTAIYAGFDHACAIVAGGDVMCWGRNAFGECGTGAVSTTPILSPVRADVVSNVKSMALGSGFTCVLTNGGAVQCFGVNVNGQLGSGTMTPSLTPVQAGGLNGSTSVSVSTIAAGETHMCAALPSSVLCWGGNSNGQLGDSSDAGTATPSLVTGLGYTVELSATSYTTCSRGNDSSIHCWGSGQAGQLGDGMMVDSYVPVSVAGLGGTLAEVSAGEAHACGRTSSGEALCWGDNSEQQIGNSGAGAQISTPIGVSGLATGVVDIHAGRYHTCAITSGGATYCWGANNYGQLGIGTITYQPPITAPVQVVDL